MRVRVQYYSLARELLGKEWDEVELPEGSTLGELLDHLIEKYGQDFKNLFYEKSGEAADRMLIFVDGSDANLAKDAHLQLKPNSRIQFFQPVAGG